MKVVLTHGYFIYEDVKEKEIMRPYPPLGILYIAAYLRQEGIPCEVFDSTFESKESWKAYMQQHQPDVVLFYTNLMTKINVIQLNNWLTHQCSNTKTVLGGPDVTYNIENYLQCGFDFAVIGEGEQTTHELLVAIREGRQNFESIHGLAFLQNEKIVQTPARAKLKSLEQLPLPAREAIPIEKYLQIWKQYHGKATINVSTQRGCPYTCKWCSTAVYGQSYRRRPVHQVVDEIQLLQQEYGVEAIWFVDDVFTVSHKWLSAFHAEMMSRAVKVEFEIITRAERLTPDVLRQLKEMGCFRIWIGAESGSQTIVDAMDRKVSVHEVRSKINLTQEMGMEAGTFIMVGYPGETHEDIEETVQHLREATPDQFTITLAYPIKGTALYKEVASKIKHWPEWKTSTDRDLFFERPYSDHYYQNAIRYISNQYNAFKYKKQGDRIRSWKHTAKAKVALQIMKRELSNYAVRD